MFLLVRTEFREKVGLVRIYQISPFGSCLLRIPLYFLALGYLLITLSLKFAKWRAMMFLAQLEFQTFPQSFFFFFLPLQNALAKLEEALTLLVFGRNHGLCVCGSPDIAEDLSWQPVIQELFETCELCGLVSGPQHPLVNWFYEVDRVIL